MVVWSLVLLKENCFFDRSGSKDIIVMDSLRPAFRPRPSLVVAGLVREKSVGPRDGMSSGSMLMPMVQVALGVRRADPEVDRSSKR
jgi:hypothetical protein